MLEELIIAGFGGQGIMLIGQMLAYAGLKEDRRVLWLPVYGPETRGGFANCTVVISDEEIGSPIVDHPGSLIIMNLPSLDRFEPLLAPGGLLVVNSSLINRQPSRTDARIVMIPATQEASAMGNTRVANMIALGAYAEISRIVSFDSLFGVLDYFCPEKQEIRDLNRDALKRGAAIASSCLV
jgi:2-oxoglutarate ferredoxin oxidoreductase subunit gamma